jgi:hypothetical protein
MGVPPHDTVTVTLEVLAESVDEETEAVLVTIWDEFGAIAANVKV